MQLLKWSKNKYGTSSNERLIIPYITILETSALSSWSRWTDDQKPTSSVSNIKPPPHLFTLGTGHAVCLRVGLVVLVGGRGLAAVQAQAALTVHLKQVAIQVR